MSKPYLSGGTPILLLVEGLLHREAKHFLKRITANLAHTYAHGKSPIPKRVGPKSRPTSLYHHKGIQFVFEGFTSEVEEWTWDGCGAQL